MKEEIFDLTHTLNGVLHRVRLGHANAVVSDHFDKRGIVVSLPESQEVLSRMVLDNDLQVARVPVGTRVTIDYLVDQLDIFASVHLLRMRDPNGAAVVDFTSVPPLLAYRSNYADRKDKTSGPEVTYL